MDYIPHLAPNDVFDLYPNKDIPKHISSYFFDAEFHAWIHIGISTMYWFSKELKLWELND